MAAIKVDRRELNRLMRFVRDGGMAREFFELFLAGMKSDTQLRFRQERAPDGTPWQPSRRALKEGGLTLTDKGHLRDSITYSVAPDGSSAVLGSNQVYASIHQFGGVAGRGHSVTLPARPYLGVTPDDEAEALSILNEVLGMEFGRGAG